MSWIISSRFLGGGVDITEFSCDADKVISIMSDLLPKPEEDVEAEEVIEKPRKKYTKKIKEVVNKKSRSERVITCKMCGKTGHMAKTCPNKVDTGAVALKQKGGKLTRMQFYDARESNEHDMPAGDIAIQMDVAVHEINLALEAPGYEDYLTSRSERHI